MDSRGRPTGDPAPEAVEFIRFCYRRRRTGWPEIYDEMCAVAGRGLFNGWTHTDLADHGVRFSLFELPALAALVGRVIAEEDARRRAGPPSVVATRPEACGDVVQDPVREPVADRPTDIISAIPRIPAMA